MPSYLAYPSPANSPSAEILDERAAQRVQVVHDLLLGNAAADLRHGDMLGDQPHAQHVAAQDHHRLPAQLRPEEFGVARVAEIVALYALLVEGCRDDGVERPFLQILRRRAQRFDRSASGLGRSLARLRLPGLPAYDQVGLAAAGVACRGHGVERHRFGVAQRISVIGRRRWRTVDDGREELRHARVGKGLEDHLPADAVRVSLRDAYFEFVFRHRYIYFNLQRYILFRIGNAPDRI